MPPTRIDVTSAQRSYPVIVGAGLLSATSPLLADAGLRHPVIVSVPPVWRRHGLALTDLAGVDGPVLMGDGERHKTLATVSKLYDAFLKRSIARTSTVVALGGGVVGDVAGFARPHLFSAACRSYRFRRRCSRRWTAPSAARSA